MIPRLLGKALAREARRYPEGQAQAEPAEPTALFANRRTRLELWQTVHTGFYPPIHDRRIPADIWLSDYVRTYNERDLRTLINVGDLTTFERFVKLCAGRVGQLANTSALAADCGIAVDTARRWLSALVTSFVVFLLPPHHRNFNKRLIKSSKLYFHDTGLACHLLGIRERGQLLDHPLRGGLFESYVVSEAAKGYWNHRRTPPIHFWRDQTGHEIDLLVEDGTRLYPVEIKSGATVASDSFAGLSWWSALAGASAGKPTLVYAGHERHDRGGVAVRPWYSI